MRHLRKIEAVEDLAWFERADISLTFTTEISATPDQVFDVLADHARWTEWFSPVKTVTNIGPASGVGARRTVQVPPLTVDEVFVAWDNPSRYTFTITAISLPVVSRMAEDWQLRETPTGTHVTNVIAADLPRPLRPFKAIIRAGMKRTTRTGPPELKQHIEADNTQQ